MALTLMTGLRRSLCLIPKFALCAGRSLTVPSVSKRTKFHKITSIQRFSSTVPKPKKETVVITFIDRDGDHIQVKALIGSNLLDVAIDNQVELEGIFLNFIYQRVTVHLKLEDGSEHSVKAKVGDNLLDIIVDNDLEIDGFGACEGTLACSTCHLIFKPDDYKLIPEKPTDEELDMLDLAFGLTDTSRLGCQVIVTKDMDGWEISVPSGVADARDA